MELIERIQGAGKWLRKKLGAENPTQTVYFPANGSQKEINGILVESFYVAGYGGWGFNYVDGYYIEGREMCLEYNILVMTPNSFGANRSAAAKVIDVERDPKYVKMDIQPIPRKRINYILKKLNLPAQ